MMQLFHRQRFISAISLFVLSSTTSAASKQNETLLTTTKTCQDSTRPFLVNKVLRTCDWVGNIDKSTTKKRCSKDKNKVATHCPKTCGLCEGGNNYCNDSKKKFALLTNGELKLCSWVKQKNTVAKCQKIGDEHTCRKSCNQCTTNEDKLTVGVYYYPWWSQDFHGGGYLRNELRQPQQVPALGEYDDTKSSVIAQHMKWSRQSNIDLWVSSWWGKDSREDLNIKNNILTHSQLRNLKIAIFYETDGLIDVDDNENGLENVQSDLKYLCQEFFNHPNYYTVDGLPVIFVYLTRLLWHENKLPQTIELMRKGARKGGCGEIFIVGDQVWGSPPSSTDDEEEMIPFTLLDAITNYDVYGNMGGGWWEGYIKNKKNVVEHYELQNEWKNVAKDNDCSYVVSVSPGYNDMGIRPEVGHFPLSRRLNANKPEGSMFKTQLKEARKVVDSDIDNLIMVNSFNEWHEDTQIEPCLTVDGNSGGATTTALPTNLTFGLEYEAYGSLYLDILKSETESWNPSMVV